VNEKLVDAANGVTLMSHVPGVVQRICSASDNLKSNPDTFSAILAPLRVFNSIVDEIADVRLYASTMSHN
jgi:hypothetical protein